MARFDVYEGPAGSGLLLDCQSNLLRDLNTRFVVPLMPLESAPLPARRLNPVFRINGRDYAMVTQFAAAITRRDCGAVVASLDSERSTIVAALDMLITGY